MRKPDQSNGGVKFKNKAQNRGEERVERVMRIRRIRRGKRRKRRGATDDSIGGTEGGPEEEREIWHARVQAGNLAGDHANHARMSG